MWFMTRMMRISWKEKKSNELVLKEANLERSLIKTIRQRQLEFLGHACRHKGLEHLAITGKIGGKRSRGRQRITFIENLKSWAIGNGSNNNFIRLTENSKEIDEGQPDSGRDTQKKQSILPETFQSKNKLLKNLELSLVSCRSKKGKNVFLLSTKHSVPERCKTSGKPEIVLTYNKSKGGVDTMDQMAYVFTLKTKRWLLGVLFNIIDLSTNATRVIRQARLSEHKLPHDDN
ncbi:PiggyBac transposable element-derived protein 4 [Plakobranchus ocellatus]|uniref:PiggyBac transposable element-derived protein 4 n=1 Tax=Plakobranchus ocellatus TaxID=259542 RepID=A0AAV4D4A4_9GAST|nr:PiggyBac transposable element-derived protein 4 [Plakobranchus ocellatus]